MKKLIVLLVAATTAAVALGAATPASAKHGKGRHHHLIRGVVQSVGSDSITLELRSGVFVTIKVTLETKIVVNGQAGTLSDIHNGFGAVVAVRHGAAKEIHARQLPASGTV